MPELYRNKIKRTEYTKSVNVPISSMEEKGPEISKESRQVALTKKRRTVKKNRTTMAFTLRKDDRQA